MLNTKTLTLNDIKKMDTVHQGQYEDLKHEDMDKGIRVWLSRVEHNTAHIEYFDGHTWQVVRTIKR